MTIKSVSYDQIEIIKSILSIEGIETFDADFTYGNGGFYKDLAKPRFRFDIDDGLNDLTHVCSSTQTPLEPSSINSIMFDPPFLTYIKQGRTGNGNMVMAKRFGGYWLYSELEEHYRKTICEAYRVLKSKGIFVIKCQDIIHNHKMHCTHINTVNWASPFFRLKDLYILPAKHRMGMPEKPGEKKRQQKHARIYHSYFLVMEKL